MPTYIVCPVYACLLAPTTQTSPDEAFTSRRRELSYYPPDIGLHVYTTYRTYRRTGRTKDMHMDIIHYITHTCITCSALPQRLFSMPLRGKKAGFR
ncbi:hypothetical protein F4820DRAFT_425531 [Hypoxylon rubiginosum]|uniref:Uncharacterized protein n=1 Tax=Hypoxylon rubiginosum TaxID=110542 RepID=A0ACB9YWW1_9PEZI|nr:hypothetical protein F4820DRAFT_425531 [Hypoxylon rubiginosum]